MNRVEFGYNPITLGYQFGYSAPHVIRRIDELAGLRDGWHFGEGRRPSGAVLASAKMVASYATSCGFPSLDAFPSKNGGISVVIYVDSDDHSFQVQNDLSFRYWNESDPDSDIEAVEHRRHRDVGHQRQFHFEEHRGLRADRQL